VAGAGRLLGCHAGAGPCPAEPRAGDRAAAARRHHPTRREIGWSTRGVGAFLPEPFQRFRDHLPEALRDGNLADGCASLLADPDSAVAQAAARARCGWEAALVALDPALPPDPGWDDTRSRLGFARLVTHFRRHVAWLPEDHLLHGMQTLAGVPGTLIHGRLDLGSPLGTAWALHQAWPGSPRGRTRPPDYTVRTVLNKPSSRCSYPP
jgi:proline iminopeptidase